DMTDSGGLNRLVKTVRPDEIYNLAAQSHVGVSFDQPEYTGDADGLGTTRLLEAIRTSGIPTRFYQASTSEMFGISPPPQNESPRRGENFVTRKVTRGIAQILAGKLDQIRLGNLDSKRDWGHARDYVEAMWMMLQLDEADDFVIATGVMRSVTEFAQAAFEMAGLDWHKHVVSDEAYMRPAEVHELRGDASKAAREFGWKPK